MGINQSVQKACVKSLEHFERAWVWHLLYICHYHFSISYGPPPVIHDHEPLCKYELYLESSLVIEGESRLVSSHCVIMALINCFEGVISDLSLSQPAGSNLQLDNWRNSWRTRIGRFFDLRIGNHPPPAPQGYISC